MSLRHRFQRHQTLLGDKLMRDQTVIPRELVKLHDSVDMNLLDLATALQPVSERRLHLRWL